MDQQTAPGQTFEIWKNTGKGLIIVKRLNTDGTLRDEPIQGGKEIRVVGEDRRAHAAETARPQQDPYRNGLLRPMNDAARAGFVEQAESGDGNSPWSSAYPVGGQEPAVAPEDEPAIPASATVIVGEADAAARIAALEAENALLRAGALTGAADTVQPPPTYQVQGEDGNVSTAAAVANPFPPVQPVPAAATPAAPEPTGPLANLLSDEETQTVHTGNGNRAKAILKRVTSAPVVEQLLADARPAGASAGRLDMIQKRLLELNPHAQPVRHQERSNVQPGEPMPEPQGMTDPSDGPQNPAGLGADGPPQDPQGDSYVPGEPVLDDGEGDQLVDPRRSIVPGGVPDGQPLPQIPPGLEVHPD